MMADSPHEDVNDGDPQPGTSTQHDDYTLDPEEANNRQLGDVWWNAAEEYQREQEETNISSPPVSITEQLDPAVKLSCNMSEDACDHHDEQTPDSTTALEHHLQLNSDDDNDTDNSLLQDGSLYFDDMDDASWVAPSVTNLNPKEQENLHKNMAQFPHVFQSLENLTRPEPETSSVLEPFQVSEPAKQIQTQGSSSPTLTNSAHAEQLFQAAGKLPDFMSTFGTNLVTDQLLLQLPTSPNNSTPTSPGVNRSFILDLSSSAENPVTTFPSNQESQEEEIPNSRPEYNAEVHDDLPNNIENDSDELQRNGIDVQSSATNKNVHQPFTDSSSSANSEEAENQADSSGAPPTISPRITYKIDGLMVVGDTWNIVTIDGTLHFYNLFTVTSEPAMHYKGLPHAMEANYRYEIPFAIVDNCTLSLLITSNENRSTNKRKGKHPVAYNDMCNAFQDIVRESMKISDGLSWTAHQLNAASGIAIKHQDWEVIGNIVADRLHNHASRNNQTENSDDEEDEVANPTRKPSRAFPHNARFCFLLKKFGHDMPFETTVYPNPYPHIQYNHCSTTRVIVHVAHDYIVEKDLLFFNQKFFQHLYQKLGVLPTHQYNIGIIPNSNNYMYMNMPTNTFNVAGMQQYTRIFNEVHRNPYEFFCQSVIAKAMLFGYVSKLNQTVNWSNRRKDQTLVALRSGRLNSIEKGISRILASPPLPIPARCEFVWAFPLNQHRQDEDDEQPDFNSFIDILEKAFQDCLQFKMHYDVCRVNLFTVYKRKTVTRYLRNLTKTLFGTITSNLKKLESLFNVSEDEKIYEGSLVFTDEDFAAIAVSEAMLTRLLRGDMRCFPNFLEKMILIQKDIIEYDQQQQERLLEMHDEEVEEQPGLTDETIQILKTCWPFDKNFIWKREGVLVTSLPLTKIFRAFPDILGGREQGQHMVNLANDFARWKSTPKCPGIELVTSRLFQTLSVALFQRLLAINADTSIPSLGVNSRAADDENALRNIWNFGQVHPNQKVQVKFSLSAYSTVCDDTGKCVYRKLAPLILFMRMLRKQQSEKLEGGFKRCFAIELDQFMLKSRNPFLYRLPQRKIVPVFIPITFKTYDQAYVQMYNRSFYAIYNKKIGDRGIHVEKFMEAVVHHIATISHDSTKRDEYKAGHIFDFIYKLLDTNRIPNDTELFKSVPLDLSHVLLNVSQGAFAIPVSRAPKAKFRSSIHEELVVPASHDPEKRCLRSVTKKAEKEKKEKEAEQLRLQEEALKRQNDLFMENLIPGFNRNLNADVTEFNGDLHPDEINSIITSNVTEPLPNNIDDHPHDILSDTDSDPLIRSKKPCKPIVASDSDESATTNLSYSSDSESKPKRKPCRRIIASDSEESATSYLSHGSDSEQKPTRKPCRRIIASDSEGDDSLIEKPADDILSDTDSDPKPTNKHVRRAIASDSESDIGSLISEPSSADQSNLSYDADSDEKRCPPKRRVDTPRPVAQIQRTRVYTFASDTDEDEEPENNELRSPKSIQSESNYASPFSNQDLRNFHYRLTPPPSSSSDSENSLVSHPFNTYSTSTSNLKSPSSQSLTQNLNHVDTPRPILLNRYSGSDSGHSQASYPFNTYSTSRSNQSITSSRSVTGSLVHAIIPRFIPCSPGATSGSGRSIMSNPLNTFSTPRSNRSSPSVTQRSDEVATRKRRINVSTHSEESVAFEDSDENASPRSSKIRRITNCPPSVTQEIRVSDDCADSSSSVSSSSSSRTVRPVPTSKSTISTSFSDNSVYSEGYLYRTNKRKLTGSPYDGMEFYDSYTRKAVTPKPSNPNLIPRMRRPFTREEDFKIFDFLSRREYMMYMFGNNVYKLMEKLKIVDRSYLSLQSRVSKIARSPYITSFLDRTLAEEVKRAREKIKCSKHTNVITLEELEYEHNVRLT